MEDKRINNVDDLTAYVVNYVREKEGYWEKFSGNWWMFQKKNNTDLDRLEIVKEKEAVSVYGKQMGEVRRRYREVWNKGREGDEGEVEEKEQEKREDNEEGRRGNDNKEEVIDMMNAQ